MITRPKTRPKALLLAFRQIKNLENQGIIFIMVEPMGVTTLIFKKSLFSIGFTDEVLFLMLHVNTSLKICQ